MIRFKLSRSHEQIRGVLDGIRILSDSGSVRERLIDYGAWLYSSERSLCSIADDEDVAALLHSPRHRRLIQAATTVGHYQEGEAYTNLMSQQLGLEVEATIRKIQDLRDEVQAAHERWSQAVSIAVLDTSLVMEHQADIGTVDLHSILGADQSGVVGAVIPITVVEELERQKDRGQDGDRRPAREALRLIESWFPDIRLSVAPSVMRHADTKRSVWFEVLFDDGLRQAPPEVGVVNDQTIVNVAAVVQQLSGTGVALLSHDTAQRLRARQAGGAARNLDGQRRAKFPKSQAQGA